MRLPRRKSVVAGLAIFGLMSLSYLLGAGVMFFELPTSDFLRRAFIGGQAWWERNTAPTTTLNPDAPVECECRLDKPEKTFDGFTLYSADRGSQALLMDMRGKVLHKWAVPYSQ